jgi:hypothetical protein
MVAAFDETVVQGLRLRRSAEEILADLDQAVVLAAGSRR